MKIGIFCGAVGYGGSQNTTASIALAVAERGHDVKLYVDKNRFRSLEDVSRLEIVDLPRHLLSSPVWGYFSIRNGIRAIRAVRKNRCDAMLCVGFGHVPIAMLISVLFKIPCVYYQVSPFMPRETRLFRVLIVANSEEAQELLAKRFKILDERIPIVRARINSDLFTSRVPSRDTDLNGSEMKAVMMCRLGDDRSAGVLLVMKAIHKLSKNGKKISLDILGDGIAMSELRAEAVRINTHIGTNVITLLGAVDSVQNELPRYDIAIGIGRCAWEAMACGKATIVVGNEGLGGIVCPENLPRLMRHNFTARGNRKKPDAKEVANVIQTLLDNPDYRKKLGDYGLDVIKKYYDVKIGAQILEQILQNAVTGTSDQYLRIDHTLIIDLIILKIYHMTKCLAKWVFRPRESIHSFRNTRRLSRFIQ